MNHWVTCPAGGLHFLFFTSSIWKFFWLTLRWIYNIYQLSSELFLCYWPNNLASSFNLKSLVETRPWSVLFWLFGFLETRSQYVVHAGLKLSPASVPLVLGSQVFCLGSLSCFPRVLCLDSLKHTPCSCSQWGNWTAEGDCCLLHTSWLGRGWACLDSSPSFSDQPPDCSVLAAAPPFCPPWWSFSLCAVLLCRHAPRLVALARISVTVKCSTRCWQVWMSQIFLSFRLPSSWEAA